MNPVPHMVLNYVILSLVIPNVREYLVPIALFAVILDIDHIPGLIRMLFTYWNQVEPDDSTWVWRTALQEPVGILSLEIVLLVLYLLGIRGTLMLIASVSFALHWLIDVLTVHTKPFVPVDDRTVSLFFHTRKQRVVSEVAATIISVALFAIVYL